MRKTFIWAILFELMGSVAAAGQTTIYWKRDTIYAGPGGGAIATIAPAPSDTTAPSAPSSLGVTSTTATSVALSWTGSTDSGSGLAGYKVYRQRGASGPNLPVGTVNSSTTAFTDQPLEPNQSYFFTIVAFDQAQNHSSASNSVNPTTSTSSGDTTAPSAPTNLRGIPTTRQSTYKLRLDWDAATDAGGSAIAGYKVYRGGTLISGGSPITNRYYEDSTNTAKTSFTYEVKAIDGSSNLSASSNAVSVTTLRELIFKDDFERIDLSSLSGCLTPAQGNCWDYGWWQVASTRATFDRTRLAQYEPSAAWIEAPAVPLVQTNFKATAQIVINPNKTGLRFWDNYYSEYPPRFYRAYITGTTLKLTFNVWDSSSEYVHWDQSDYIETVLATASVAASTGKLVVDATMSSRQIRVYYNDTLKIDYTESDTSRPNQGRFSLTAYATTGDSSDVFIDDVVLEK